MTHHLLTLFQPTWRGKPIHVVKPPATNIDYAFLPSVVVVGGCGWWEVMGGRWVASTSRSISSVLMRQTDPFRSPPTTGCTAGWEYLACGAFSAPPPPRPAAPSLNARAARR